MINTSLRNAKQWYFDAVVGSLILHGYTKREAKKIVRRYKLRHKLNQNTLGTLHTPVKQTVEEIRAAMKRGEI